MIDLCFRTILLALFALLGCISIYRQEWVFATLFFGNIVLQMTDD